jgi:hypothetical protein
MITVYDGSWQTGPLTVTTDHGALSDFKRIANSTFAVEFKTGEEIYFNVSGAGRNAGKYTLSCNGFSGNESVDPDDFTFTFTPCTLTIEKVKITADLQGDTLDRVFGEGGSIITPALTYSNGEHKGESITRTDGSGMIGNVTSNYTLFDGTRLSVKVTGGNDNNAGTHSLTATSTQTGPYDVENFEGEYTNDEYTVTKAPITIHTASAQMYWTGEALTESEAWIEGLVGNPDYAYSESDYPEVRGTGSQTEIGWSDNGYGIKWNGFYANNYSITEDLGILEVLEPIPFTTDDPPIGYEG